MHGAVFQEGHGNNRIRYYRMQLRNGFHFADTRQSAYIEKEYFVCAERKILLPTAASDIWPNSQGYHLKRGTYVQFGKSCVLLDVLEKTNIKSPTNGMAKKLFHHRSPILSATSLNKCKSEVQLKYSVEPVRQDIYQNAIKVISPEYYCGRRKVKNERDIL